MFLVPNYTTTEAIQEDENTATYRGYRNGDQQRVIIKLLKAEYPTSTNIALFERDYQITKRLRSAKILKVHHLEKYNNRVALIFEDFAGKPLQQYLKDKPIGISDFLIIAIKISESLATVHSNNIIHKNLSTQAIWINTLDQIKLTNFSVASLISDKHKTNYLAENLSYISPEQTGRINRVVNFRTDFYSLGVIFFEMLAGHLPFPASDPMELIHSHIAKQPLWLYELNKKIPIVVSNIVAKLLSKSAEDRYQSASGLKYDLEKCLEQWSKKRKIDEFILAKKDRINQLQISQKLYGREQEVSQLLNIFKRASPDTKTEIVLVSGLSGVGKTALVNEIKETVFDQSGYFVSGKFSSIKRNIPYDPIIQAFQSLIQQLLTESDNEIKIWQKNILAALGSNHQIIVDVIPKLEFIVGQVSPVAQLTTQESEKRFNYIFQQFINVFTKKRHPLVLFFDDLQWADPASLKLIQLLVNQPESKYLLIIGSLREDEINDSHPLNLMLNEFKKSEVKVNQVFLAPLNLNSVNKLIADMLEFELDTVKSLSELIFRKTNGNPFFINQLLQTLYQRKLLYFNDKKFCWTWKLEEISKIDITENVVNFLIKKINNLSTEAQKLLKIAACIGNSFELNILSLVYKKPQEKVSNILIEVVQEGLILPTSSCSSLIQNHNQDELNTYYCFVHDKIQQAAYSLLTVNQKRLFHLQIGRVMLNYTYRNKLEENLFEIVNQFNSGIELVTHQNEIDELAKLNLLAGKKAKASTAYESACQYLEKAQEILSKNQDTWKNYYRLMFSLNLELSECKYLSGRFEEAEKIFNLVLQQSQTKLEMAKVYILKINLYTDRGNLKQAIDIGLEAVKLFKITLPPKNIKLAISREIEKVQTKIGDQHIKDLYNLPEATDKSAVAIMNIFMSLAASTYFINLDLWALLMLKMINLSLKYGNTEVSSFAYSAYGLLIGSAFGNYQAGYEFGQLALKVNKKFNNLALNSKIYFMFGAFINHWKNHVSSDFDYLKKSFNFGNETGDPSFSSYASNILVAEMYIKGDHLNNVFKESKQYSDYVNKVKNIHGIYFQATLQQMILNLQGLTNNVFTWNTNQGKRI